MKVVGILVISLLGALGAGGQQLYAGGGFWAALVNYLAVGFAITAVGVCVLILRSLYEVRPGAKTVMRSAATAAQK